MKVQASKTLIVLAFFMVGLLISVLSSTVAGFTFEPSKIAFSIAFSLTLSILMLFFCKYDIEITENGEMLGGYNFKGRPHFLSKNTVDVERCKKRSLLDRLIGRYKFYDKNGRQFRLMKPFFSKTDFEVIKEKAQSILGFTLP